jgi:hypothetical protein
VIPLVADIVDHLLDLGAGQPESRHCSAGSAVRPWSFTTAAWHYVTIVIVAVWKVGAGRSAMSDTERASGQNAGRSTQQVLHPFATEMRHLTSALNVIASDMIRDRTLAKKLDNDLDYFRKNYSVTDEELNAMRDRNMVRLYELGLHPFLLVRFAGMMGILEYWQELGAPGRGGGWPRNV